LQKFKQVQELPFDPDARRRRVVIVDSRSQTDYLVVIGSAEISYSQPFAILDREHDLTFLGYVTLVDSLRPSTKQTIETVERMGDSIKILTGDSKEAVGC
jgi:Mg2+-importing ATPase